MKKVYIVPLASFLVVAVVPSFFFMPRNAGMILGFAQFLFGFSLTYLAMVREALKNKDAILTIGERMPFIMPVLIFAFSTIVSSFFFIPRDSSIIIPFSSCFGLSLIAYSLGAAIIFKGLQSARLQRTNIHAENSGGKKVLVLVNPVNPHKGGLTVNASSRFPPLGLGIIAALTPDDYHVILIDENVKAFEFVPCDLVGITAFTSSANRAYEIAAIYRKAGITVVMGGIHASMVSEEAARYADSIVIGEAEGVWRELLSDFEQGRLKRRYEGVAADLSGTVTPRRDLFSSDYLFATVQTSRGCPMDCYFCSVSPFNGRKYRQRPVEEVLDELEHIDQEFIFFVDDNILGYGKGAEERALRLFKGMVERKMKKSWFCQASVNFGDNPELLRWAAKSGCRMVFIGLESADPEELEAMGKSLNLKRNYERAFRAIHNHGIVVLGAFIYGSDAESPASMARKTEYIQKAPVDVVQTTILTPLPGTRLFAQYESEGRLVYKDFPADWDRFDMGELTYSPRLMDREEFARTLEKCWKRIYSSPSLAFKFLRTLFLTRSMTAAFWARSSNLNYKNTGQVSKERVG